MKEGKIYLTKNVIVSGYTNPTAISILSSIPKQIVLSTTYSIKEILKIATNWEIIIKTIVSNKDEEFTFLFTENHHFLGTNMLEIEILDLRS